MSKSQPESNVEFNAEELEVMKIVEKRNIIMAIDFESRTPEQKQALEEYDKKLNNEYQETYARLLRKNKNNQNELIVMKALKEKNTRGVCLHGNAMAKRRRHTNIMTHILP